MIGDAMADIKANTPVVSTRRCKSCREVFTCTTAPGLTAPTSCPGCFKEGR